MSKFFVAMGLLAASAFAMPSAASAAPPGYEDPLPRIEGRLCPGVSGMRTDAAVQLIGRIRHNAESLGIALDDPDVCTPNLLIFFVDDAGKMLASLMKRRSYLFGTLSVAERNQLASGDRPVRFWNQVVTRSRDGMEVSNADNLVQIPHTAGDG